MSDHFVLTCEEYVARHGGYGDDRAIGAYYHAVQTDDLYNILAKLKDNYVPNEHWLHSVNMIVGPQSHCPPVSAYGVVDLGDGIVLIGPPAELLAPMGERFGFESGEYRRWELHPCDAWLPAAHWSELQRDVQYR
jgi:hypothetical protein